ncbi:uncharacterized protein LOC143911304 isoform X2 [Arctopsyche grandis]
MLVVNGVITQNWINTNKFSIKKLRISSKNIINVEDDSFNGQAFEELEILSLVLMKIEVLQEGTFRGLQMLKELNLQRCTVKQINEKALLHVASSLQTLLVHEMQLEFNPKNLTGSILLPGISTIDFSYNKLGKNLKRESISHVGHNLVQIYLLSSQIEQIGCGTFEKMTSLKQIFLSGNMLSTLEPCVFGETVINNLPIGAIYINQNYWNCDCCLLWLKQLRIQKKIAGNPTCQSNHSLPFEAVEFCNEDFPNCPSKPEESTTTTTTTTTITTTSTQEYEDTTSATSSEESTTITTTITTTSTTTRESENTTLVTDSEESTLGETLTSPEGSSNTINLKCYVNQNDSQTTIFQYNYTYINFDLTSKGDKKFQIKIDSIMNNNDAIIWFEGRSDPNKTFCRTNFKTDSEFDVDDLEQGISYIFCYLHNGRILSPWNCKSKSTPPPFSLRPWIINEDKAFIIGIITFMLLICVFLGAVIVFIAIRKNPSLLRGSKRVVMVKKSDAIVMPAKFKAEEKCAEFKRDVTARTSFRRTTFRRSVSETSIMSGSYVSAAEPTTVQLLNWRLERLRSRNNNEKVIMESVTPPPLAARPGVSNFPDDYDSFSGISMA